MPCCVRLAAVGFCVISALAASASASFVWQYTMRRYFPGGTIGPNVLGETTEVVTSRTWDLSYDNNGLRSQADLTRKQMIVSASANTPLANVDALSQGRATGVVTGQAINVGGIGVYEVTPVLARFHVLVDGSSLSTAPVGETVTLTAQAWLSVTGGATSSAQFQRTETAQTAHFEPFVYDLFADVPYQMGESLGFRWGVEALVEAGSNALQPATIGGDLDVRARWAGVEFFDASTGRRLVPEVDFSEPAPDLTALPPEVSWVLPHPSVVPEPAPVLALLGLLAVGRGCRRLRQGGCESR